MGTRHTVLRDMKPLTAEDCLRLYVHDPDTFEFAYEDADKLCREINSLRSMAVSSEPVAWRWRVTYRDDWCWSTTKPSFAPIDLERRIVFDVQPLFTTPTEAGSYMADEAQP